MCLYPRIVLNPKYLGNKKNGGRPPRLEDPRVKYVAVGCGNCIECRKQKANGWRIRLNEELKESKGHFVTLTFGPEQLKELIKESKCKAECNAVAMFAVRRFLERYRKKYKKSVKHFLITELGNNETERIHLHGIIFKEDLTNEELSGLWKYGKTDIGYKCDLQTINYVVKYITKIDEKHKNFKAQIACSPGIGKSYTERNANKHRYIKKESIYQTNEAYQLPDGTKLSLPIYYRNKIYSEDEREKLWIEKIEENKRYVLGLEIDMERNENQYWTVLKSAQYLNRELGYGDDSREWKKEDYNINLRQLKKEERKRSRGQSVPRGLPRSLRSHGGGGGQTHGAI